MIYTTLFLIGLLGLLALVLLGAGHFGHGHAGHGGAQGHAGHGHGGSHGTHAPANTHGGSQGHASPGHDAPRGLSPLWGMLSPLVLFSGCVGIGATGLLLKPLHWAAWLTAGAAIAGGVVFYRALVKPVWGMVFAFASVPSEALDGAVAAQAVAVSRFDTAGRGVVRLILDGQTVRLLATLEPDDRAQAVVPGDKLTVTSVDGRANSCRVARLE